ncbi:MAG TPA: hypothetical protein VMT27_05750, partial [Actinomycetes bacterium]|nr:hypothetical protein [Actinomycetes bacterium]
MWAVRAASGSQPGRSHTVGFIGLGLAVVLTFLVLWAVFFRGAASEVSQKGDETAASALSPGPAGTPAENNATESAATPLAAPGSTVEPSPKGPPGPHASVGNGIPSEELNKFDQLRKSVDDTTGVLAMGNLSPARAKTQYEAFAGDYVLASRGVGSLTNDTRPAQLHSAVMQAASAYEVWIRQLQSTSWPPEVQPYVDNYLVLATTKGRALFKH